ncbi:unnamed protein product [Ostreobium quekettii]|uniref:Tr-type G domain-containing protein n=1 Tax=Ostreobium quekettii TaxID=121088 RepID=A0A8S1IUC8_9CHLO|nr:unnamed protein product [Ostreobium quekettii]
MAAAQVADDVAEDVDELVVRSDIRNLAIIAHVDHGKTTLVDAMLQQSRVFRDNQSVEERIMDSNDLERERGITILSKNTAIRYQDCKINIIDTPGHADFGGEVERILNMADGVLLLVDAVEGPMPQTRFVLRKALELDKKVIVVVNKIDREAARPDYVVDATFELFLELGANDAQCDFPVVYASGFQGVAGMKADDLEDSLEPLFETIMKEIDPPSVQAASPLQMLVTNIDFKEHKGRMAIGRVQAGTIKQGSQIAICKEDDESACRTGRVVELLVYDSFKEVPVDEVQAGDICAVAGLPDVKIGETITHTDAPNPLPTITVEEPTVTMSFMVNTSPFAGREGKFVTTRNIKERLERELERNLALKVTPGATPDVFMVSGRGGLHLSILIETMRREGYEIAVGPITVITKTIDGKTYEPFEEALVEVPEEHMGSVVELFGRRKGRMLDMSAGLGATQVLKYVIPTRGLLGMRSQLLTATKGTAVLNTNVAGYEPSCGEISTRDNGSLVAHETGTATAYALESCQERGIMFVKPGDSVYEGQVVGMNNRGQDMRINVCKKKQLTNMRTANKDQTVVLDRAKDMNLEAALEYITTSELVEVTPKAIRIRMAPGKIPKV